MSCSLCRLPFTPSDASIKPRYPPKNVLSEKQILHMKHAVGIGQYVIGLVIDMVYLGQCKLELASALNSSTTGA